MEKKECRSKCIHHQLAEFHDHFKSGQCESANHIYCHCSEGDAQSFELITPIVRNCSNAESSIPEERRRSTFVPDVTLCTAHAFEDSFSYDRTISSYVVYHQLRGDAGDSHNWKSLTLPMRVNQPTSV